MNYCDIEFKKKFIDINFDDILNEENNKYVNTNEYLEYKKTYLTYAKNNLKEFIKYKKEYDILNNCYAKTGNKFTFDIIDNNVKCKYNDLLKSVIQIQQKKLSNFLHYINFLNKIIKNKPDIKKIKYKSRMIKTAKKTL